MQVLPHLESIDSLLNIIEFGHSDSGSLANYVHSCRVTGNLVISIVNCITLMYEVREGDEIDFIKGFNLDMRDQVDINRVIILKVDDKAASWGRVRISFRKTNNLTVANYERDPYEMA